MNTPTRGDYDVTEVEGIDTLIERIAEAEASDTYEETVKEISFILSDYISFGNQKISKKVAIFNMNSATDCPNADSTEDDPSDVGICQVPWKKCYAHLAENQYKQSLAYRRRQEYLWDSLDSDTWALAFLKMVSRKRNEVTAIRFSEAGDFRHRGDIIKVNRIAELVGKEGIDTYTYSASHKLDWSDSEHFTVNQSNNFADYGDRLYSAIPEDQELPENAVWCPHDYQKSQGKTADEAVKCGDCKLCINKEGPNVFIPLH